MRMAFAAFGAKGISLLILLVLCVSFFSQVHANKLGFVIDQANRTSEFFEDIQKSTFVLVNYKARIVGDDLNGESDKIHILFAVKELDITDEETQTIQEQKGSFEGRFFFTTAQTGTHKLVFSTDWASNDSKKLPPVQIDVEFLFGNAGDPEVISHTEADLGRLDGFVLHLIDDANLIKQEQERLSLREIDFKKLSEGVNRSVKLIMLLQVVVILAANAYSFFQMKRFFKTKKLT